MCNLCLLGICLKPTHTVPADDKEHKRTLLDARAKPLDPAKTNKPSSIPNIPTRPPPTMQGMSNLAPPSILDVAPSTSPYSSKPKPHTAILDLIFHSLQAAASGQRTTSCSNAAKRPELALSTTTALGSTAKLTISPLLHPSHGPSDAHEAFEHEFLGAERHLLVEELVLTTSQSFEAGGRREGFAHSMGVGAALGASWERVKGGEGSEGDWNVFERMTGIFGPRE